MFHLDFYTLTWKTVSLRICMLKRNLKLHFWKLHLLKTITYVFTPLHKIQLQLHPTHKFMWLLYCYYWPKLKCINLAQYCTHYIKTQQLLQNFSPYQTRIWFHIYSSSSSVHLTILNHSDKVTTIQSSTLQLGFWRLHSFWHYCRLLQQVDFKSRTSNGGNHTT
jgi:hypothetical protein